MAREECISETRPSSSATLRTRAPIPPAPIPGSAHEGWPHEPAFYRPNGMGQRYDDSALLAGAAFSLKHLIMLLWCVACFLGTIRVGLVPLATLGCVLMLFVLWPPVRFSHGGRLWPARRFRWVRRPYRLSDWPRVLYRARLALPAVAILALLFCEAPPADLYTLFTVAGVAGWSVWLALHCSSQRGEIAWQWTPLQLLPLAALACFLVAAAEPQNAANLTGVPVRQRISDEGHGVQIYSLRFGPWTPARSAREWEILPETRPAAQAEETLLERLESQRVRDRNRLEWMLQREPQDDRPLYGPRR